MMKFVEKDFERRSRIHESHKIHQDEDDDEDRQPLSAEYALKLLSEITTVSSKSSKNLAKEIRRIVCAAMSLDSSLQRQREDAAKWKWNILKSKLDASAEMLSCEELNAKRSHILQDAIRNEESRSRRLEESLARSRAEVAHERHLRVVLEKKADERSIQYESAESSLRMEVEELRKRAGVLKIEAVSAIESVRERTMQADVLRDTLGALESKNEMPLHNRVANLTTQLMTEKRISGELQIELNRLRNVAIDVTSRERLRRRQPRFGTSGSSSQDENVSSQLALQQVPVLQRRLDQVQDDLSAEQRECVRLRQLLVGAKTDAKIARAQLQAHINGQNEDVDNVKKKEQVEEMCTEKRRLELALRELEERHREFVAQSNQREMTALETGMSRVKSLLAELEATERSALIEEHRRKRCESEIVRSICELDILALVSK